MMKSFIRKVKRKLNHDGESMAEVLVAALIIELALIAAVSMIVSAGRIIVKSKAHYDQYFKRQNAVVSGKASGSSIVSENITITIAATGTEPTITPIPATFKTVTTEGSSKEVYYYDPTGS